MDGIALQTKAHKNGLDAEDTLEGSDDGDTSSATYGQRTLAEGNTYSLFCCLVSGQVNGAKVGFTAVHRLDLDADVLGGDALDIVDEGLAYLVVILVGDKTAGDLSISLGG